MSINGAINQADRFLGGAGDSYYRRNRADFGTRDPVFTAIDQLKLPVKKVLDVGCANGWRVKKFRERDIEAWGIDPSGEAVEAGNIALPPGFLTVGIAEHLPYPDDSFDVVVHGFSMSLVEPKQWFQAVAETDRVLKDGGFIILSDWCTAVPVAWKYAEVLEATPLERECFMWLIDFKKLWLGHPGYSLVSEAVFNVALVGYETCCVLYKGLGKTFRVNINSEDIRSEFRHQMHGVESL